MEQADGADKYENGHRMRREIAGRGRGGEGEDSRGRTRKGSGESKRRWGVVRKSGRAQELTRGVEMHSGEGRGEEEGVGVGNRTGQGRGQVRESSRRTD